MCHVLFVFSMPDRCLLIKCNCMVFRWEIGRLREFAYFAYDSNSELSRKIQERVGINIGTCT